MEMLETSLPSLQHICAGAARVIPAPRVAIDLDAVEELEEVIEDLKKEFTEAIESNLLTGNILCFAMALESISTGAVERLKVLENTEPPGMRPGFCALCSLGPQLH